MQFQPAKGSLPREQLLPGSLSPDLCYAPELGGAHHQQTNREEKEKGNPAIVSP